MERATFERRLLQAATIARDFARQFITEPLPDAMIFRVHLNSSYDRNAGPDVKLFPDDSSGARALATKNLTVAQAVDELCRDGWIPQWIDVYVVGETGDATVLDLLACGRFTADDTNLYYPDTDTAPFGIKGPVLPPGHVHGRPFSIYTRSSCYTLAELARARLNAKQVWSLALHGPVFGDAVLATQLQFPKLSILELYDTPIEGAGLAGLAGLPHLAHLRAQLGASERLDLGALPRLRSLETLSLRSLPRELAGVKRLAPALPRLRELRLAADSTPRADAVLDVPKLEKLVLELPDVPRWIAMPRALRDLSVHASAATDDDMCHLLAACPDRLEHVDLSRSPVSDRVLAALARFPALHGLSAADTRIARESLWHFAAYRTNFKCWPPPPQDGDETDESRRK